MAVKTLYSALGLEPEATYDDIEAAFANLKRQYPQTLLQQDEAARIRFQAIQQAHATLRDPDSRAAYDQRISRAGIRTATTAGSADSGSWLNTRNAIILGAVTIIVSGMWWYNARENARQEAEIMRQALRIAEQEKQRKAELEAQEEARRQASFEASQQRQEENRERQWRQEAQQSARQVDANLRNAQAQADAQQRREKMEADNRQRRLQSERQQQEREAQMRVQREQAELRRICMERYRRPDC